MACNAKLKNASHGIRSGQACHGNRRYGDVDDDGRAQCRSTKIQKNLNDKSEQHEQSSIRRGRKCLWQEVKEGHADDERAAKGHEMRQIVECLACPRR